MSSATEQETYSPFHSLLYAWDHLGRPVLVHGPCVGEAPVVELFLHFHLDVWVII